MACDDEFAHALNGFEGFVDGRGGVDAGVFWEGGGVERLVDGGEDDVEASCALQGAAGEVARTDEGAGARGGGGFEANAVMEVGREGWRSGARIWGAGEESQDRR